MKVVALKCSFTNLFKLCSKVLQLWRYDVTDFEKCHILVLVFAFFSMNTKPNCMISIDIKVRESTSVTHCRLTISLANSRYIT